MSAPSPAPKADGIFAKFAEQVPKLATDYFKQFLSGGKAKPDKDNKEIEHGEPDDHSPPNGHSPPDGNDAETKPNTITFEDLKKLSVEEIAKLDAKQLIGLKPEQFKELTKEQRKIIREEQGKVLSEEQLKALED